MTSRRVIRGSRPAGLRLGGAALAVALAALTACATTGDEAGATGPTEAPRLETVEERFSYGVGAKLGRDLLRSDNEVDPELLQRGLEDALAGRSILDEGEVEAALDAYGELRRERLEAQRVEYARRMRERGQAFLARNRERSEVVALESGLQYEVLEPGSGAAPTANDYVTCHYRAALMDGSVFDDTWARGEPRTFQVTTVVDGLEQGLQLMQPGARWKLYVPPDLAYGEAGMGPQIPPHAPLVFEVELLSVGEPGDAQQGG